MRYGKTTLSLACSSVSSEFNVSGRDFSKSGPSKASRSSSDFDTAFAFASNFFELIAIGQMLDVTDNELRVALPGSDHRHLTLEARIV